MEQYKNKIVLFSDLDDTLIKTKRKLDNSKKHIVAGFNKKGEEHSFITDGLNSYLDILLNAGVQIIPTTARNAGAYGRSIFSKDNRIKIAIIDFGANILINNKPDKEYANLVKDKYNNLSMPLSVLHDKIMELLLNVTTEQKLSIKILDEYYLLIRYDKDKLDEKFNNLFKKILDEFLPDEYYLYYNQTTFSILPKFLNKSMAVKYIKDKITPVLTFGLGDNINDFDFMKETDMVMLPKDCQIYEKLNDISIHNK